MSIPVFLQPDLLNLAHLIFPGKPYHYFFRQMKDYPYIFTPPIPALLNPLILILFRVPRLLIRDLDTIYPV